MITVLCRSQASGEPVTVFIDIVYVGTWIGNGVVYGPIYGNM